MGNFKRGAWGIIQWTPDVVAGEVFNIGVFIDIGCHTHYKTIKNYNKFTHLYSADDAEHLMGVIELLDGIINNGLYALSDQIAFVDKGFTKVASVEESLDRLYGRVVSLDGGQCEHC